MYPGEFRVKFLDQHRADIHDLYRMTNEREQLIKQMETDGESEALLVELNQLTITIANAARNLICFAIPQVEEVQA